MSSTGNEGGPPFKAIIFDVDQTLLYTLRRFHKVFNNTLRKFGLGEIDWERFIKLYSTDSLSKIFGSKVNRNRFWKEFLQSYDVECTKDRPIKGAKEALRKAKELGLRVIVATGRMTPVESLRKELEKHGLLDYVDSVYTAEGCTFSKGYLKERLVRRILKEEGLRPQEVIFVADYLPDMEVASRLGIYPIAVLTGLMSPEELRKRGAKWVIESVAELPRLLERILGGP